MIRRPSRPRVTAAALSLAAALGFALAGCTAAAGEAHTPSGTPTPSATHESALDIHVGDCLDDARTGTTTATAPIVPCSAPHDSEAYAEFTMSGSAFPGDDAVLAQAQTDCAGTAFADFIGIASADSQLQISYYYPTSDSWAAGDRAITCTVYQLGDDGKPATTTGTLKNAAR